MLPSKNIINAAAVALYQRLLPSLKLHPPSIKKPAVLGKV